MSYGELFFLKGVIGAGSLVEMSVGNRVTGVSILARCILISIYQRYHMATL